MRGSVSKTGTFDAEAGDGAAQGDGAQLWHAHRHQPKWQCCVDQMLVGGHAENLRGAIVDIDI